MEVATLQAEYRSCKAELDKIERERKTAAAPPAPQPPVRTSYYPPTSNVVSTASTRSSTPASATGTSSTQVTQSQANAQSGYRPPYRTYQYPYQSGFQQYSYSSYTSNNSTAAASQSSHHNNGAPNSTQAQPTMGSLAASTEHGISAPSVSVPSAPIPVQLPVSSLASLSALGIIPIPAENAPPADQPQPAAVLKGTTHNGTMVSLEINVSALGAAQASGLAVLLSALTSRNMAVGANGAAVTPLPALSRTPTPAQGTMQYGHAQNTNNSS